MGNKSKKGAVNMKFRNTFLTILVAAILIVSAIPVSAAEVRELTAYEKVVQMLGREPDCYMVALDEGIIEVTKNEFISLANELKDGTFISSDYADRITSPKRSGVTLNEEYYPFQTRATITQKMTPHTIKGNTTMWYGGDGYYLNKEGVLTLNVNFSEKPSNAYGVFKKGSTEAGRGKVGRADYAIALIAGSAGYFNPGIENLSSSSLSVTGGEINAVA